MKRLVYADAADDAPITLCHKNSITIGVAQEHKESFAPWVAATGAAVPRPPLTDPVTLFSALPLAENLSVDESSPRGRAFPQTARSVGRAFQSFWHRSPGR
jgi:hypothetical protein